MDRIKHDSPPREPIPSTLSEDPEMAELIEQYVDELPAHVAAIADAWRRADLGTLLTVSHQLKGSGAGYGFAALGAQAARLEQALREIPAHPGATSLEDIKSEVDRLVDLCRRVVVR